MIKCEVVFDRDEIWVNNFRIEMDDGTFDVYDSEMFLEWFNYLEEAIKYCMGCGDESILCFYV